MDSILEYLKKHGEKTDIEIAKATGLPQDQVLEIIARLQGRGKLLSCLHLRSTETGAWEGRTFVRLVGMPRPATPGRKPKPISLS